MLNGATGEKVLSRFVLFSRARQRWRQKGDTGGAKTLELQQRRRIGSSPRNKNQSGKKQKVLKAAVSVAVVLVILTLQIYLLTAFWWNRGLASSVPAGAAVNPPAVAVHTEYDDSVVEKIAARRSPPSSVPEAVAPLAVAVRTDRTVVNKIGTPRVRPPPPRVVFLDGKKPQPWTRMVQAPKLLRDGDRNSSKKEDREIRGDPFYLKIPKESKCRSTLAEGGTSANPTCNTFHEIDLPSPDLLASVRGSGGWRVSWKLSSPPTSSYSYALALKTIKLPGPHHESVTINRHGIDAYVSDMVTSSGGDSSGGPSSDYNSDAATARPGTPPFGGNNIVGIYGYCAESVFNTYADGPDGMRSLSKLLKKVGATNILPRQKLTFALHVARAVADLHSGGAAASDRFLRRNNPTGWKKNDGGNGGVFPVAFVHKDLKSDNVMVFSEGGPGGVGLSHGKKKLSVRLRVGDFNDSEILSEWNATSDTGLCGFRRKRWTPVFFSPEEVREEILTEKVDIWSMGGIFFHILTGRKPDHGLSEKEMFRNLRVGVGPSIPPEFLNSGDAAVRALVGALRRCHEHDPGRRPTASEVAESFYLVLKDGGGASE